MNELDFVYYMEIMIAHEKNVSKPMPMILTEQMNTNLLFKNMLELNYSSVHGKGVFAKQKLHANQVVTMYPCHGVITNEEREHHTLRNYCLELKTPNQFIVGNPDIQIDGCLGHMINDSGENVLLLRDAIEPDFIDCTDYMWNSVHLSNCVFVRGEHFIYVKTTKEIEVGEELLSSYGYEWWCTKPEMKAMMEDFLETNKSSFHEKTLLPALNQMRCIAHQPSETFRRLLQCDTIYEMNVVFHWKPFLVLVGVAVLCVFFL
jgi:hypothetical protein